MRTIVVPVEIKNAKGSGGVEPPCSCTYAQEGFPEPNTAGYALGTRTPSPPLVGGTLPIELTRLYTVGDSNPISYPTEGALPIELKVTRYDAGMPYRVLPRTKSPRPKSRSTNSLKGICYIWSIQHLYPKYIKLLNRYLVNSDRIYHNSLILSNGFYVQLYVWPMYRSYCMNIC